MLRKKRTWPGTSTNAMPAPEGSRLAAWKDTMRRLDKDGKWRVVEELATCAAELGTSPATLALAPTAGWGVREAKSAS